MYLRRVPSFVLFLVVTTAIANAHNKGDATRCGGDGPNPLADISGQFSSQGEVLKTRGAPQEFVVWQKKGEIVYRSDSGEIWTRPLSSRAETKLGIAPGALLPFFDPAERFLVTRSGQWIFDASQTRQWTPISARNMKPLFSWDDSVVGVVPNDSGNGFWKVVRVTAGSGQPEVLCPSLTLPADYRLAEGHQFPYVYFYDSKKDPDGIRLSFHAVDIDYCAIEDSVFVHPIAGKIQSVLFFDAPDSIAIKIDKPTHNLIWNTAQDGCRYFDVDNTAPLQLNPNVPVVATESVGGSLTLIDLQAATKATIIKDNPLMGKLRAGDAFLTDDRGQLFLRTEKEPLLLRLKLD